ncbi:MAG: hypothetical protein WC632_02260 [Candidatus Margulisiibacteriota bacterium]
MPTGEIRIPGGGTHELYRKKILKAIQQKLGGYASTETVAREIGRINRYPGLDNEKLNRTPQIKPYRTAARMVQNEGRVKATEYKVANGEVMLVHAVGGLATRLGMGPKYLITPEDLIEKEASAHGNFKALLRLSLGERHLLAQMFALYQLAVKLKMNPLTVFDNQVAAVIPNVHDEADIIESFKKFSNFGLGKVILSSSHFYPGIVINDGKAAENPDILDLHNHGVVLTQLTMEKELYELNANGKKSPLSSQAYREVLGRLADQVVCNIEDLDYLSTPFDYSGIAIALSAAEEGYQMMMELVRQRPDDPQPGGVAVTDPNISNLLKPLNGRDVVIESLQLNLPKNFGEVMSTFAWLNRSANNFMNPLVAHEMVRDYGLPFIPGVKKAADGSPYLVNNTPFGDANKYLPTFYIGREEPISNLKKPEHIMDALRTFNHQDSWEFRQFIARYFEATGVVLPDMSFGAVSNLAPGTPITIDAVILGHPWFMSRNERRIKQGDKTAARNKETLAALGKVFVTDGSLVYHAEVKGDAVYVEPVKETKAGTALEYISRAENGPVIATDFKKSVFLEGRVWTNFRHEGGFHCVQIANRLNGEQKGEILLLVGHYDEEAPYDKAELLKPKFDRALQQVCNLAEETGAEAPEAQLVLEEFKKLSWSFLFEHSASLIAERIMASINFNKVPA